MHQQLKQSIRGRVLVSKSHNAQSEEDCVEAAEGKHVVDGDV